MSAPRIAAVCVAVIVRAGELATLTFIAASVCTAVKECAPWDKEAVVNVQVPLPPTTAVPMIAEPSMIETVAPASPVPTRVSGEDTKFNALIVGATGAVVSIVSDATDAPEFTLPAMSVAVASRLKTD